MTRRLKIISGIVASIALIAIGAFIFAVVAGFMIDDATHVEDDPLLNTLEVSVYYVPGDASQGIAYWEDDFNGEGHVRFDIHTSGDFSYIEEESTFPENIDGGRETLDEAVQEFMEEVETSEEELELTIVSLSIHPAGHGFVSWYESPNGYLTEETEIMDAGFDISPESDVSFLDNKPPEDIRDSIVDAIQSDHKENTRAINFMEGYMNDDLTVGTMQYRSSQQLPGEVSFTVKEDGEIIKNQEDWDALPEMDEHTLEDFYHTAEQMISNWGMLSPSDSE